jgi:hypothetical protein
MKNKSVIQAVLLCMTLALSIVPAAQAAPPASGNSAPVLPPNTVASPTKCDPSTGLCTTVFQSTPGKTISEALAASPTTNLYICGVDVINLGKWVGRMQQNVYGSWGWGTYHNGWKLDSGNISTSTASGFWWASLNGPNPDVPWGTITAAEHVASSAWIFPISRVPWVNAYFQVGGGYSCTGGVP